MKNKVELFHHDKEEYSRVRSFQKVQKKERRKVVFSLSIFLQTIIITIFCLFFFVIYFLIRLQNDSIAIQSNVQFQGEVSEKIQNKIVHYLDDATVELATAYNVISHSALFQKRFDNGFFLTFANSILEENQTINALYFGDSHGNFYMAKRIDTNSISTQIIKNDGEKIISQWMHKNFDTLLMAKFKSYEEFSVDDGFDPRKRPWYQEVQKDKIAWTDPYFFNTEGLLGISASKKISRGNFTGVLGLDLDISYFAHFLKELSFNGLGHILITNENKKLIAISDKNNVAFDTASEEYFTSDNQRQRRLLSAVSLDSSEEMSFFSRNIVTLSETDLIKKSLREKNILDVLLSTFFPKYSKSISFRSLLLRGLTTGNISFNNKRYIYTYSPFFPVHDNKSWYVYTFTDTLNINASSEYLTKIIIWIFSGFIVLFILIMYQSAKILSKPLSAISHLMLNFKQLILNTKFVNHSRIRVVEIENIGAIYNDLRNSFLSFKKFVPDVVVKETLKSSSSLQASMSKKNVSVLFSDIEGFTSITERVKSEELCESLTLYFSEMSEQIQSNNGIIDKFIGDAIMAIFGTFDENTNNAQQAVHAALAMKEQEELINKKIEAIQPDIYFHTRIGINTGDAMVGIIGSDVRLNFTVIGDMVNLASRLESANKQYGSSIIVSSYAKEQAGEEFVFRFLDNVQVKGKEKFVMIYQVVGKCDTVPYMVQDYIREYEELQILFVKKNIGAAKKKIVFIEEHFLDVKDGLFESLKQKVLLEN